MNWAILILAGILEIVWAVGLKYSAGFTKLVPTVITGIATLSSFWLLSIAMRVIPLGTAYAVWTGIGIVGTVLFGIFGFEESTSILRLFFLSLILIGIVGLNWI